MKPVPFYLVDAFTDHAFGGNPAAVCPLEEWLPDPLMQSMAIEHNQSETAFFVPLSNGFELRWFTINGEINLCGHATLASAHVIFEHLDYQKNEILFETRFSGRLSVKKEFDGLVMDLPAWPPQKMDLPEIAVNGLGARPLECWLKRDYLFVFSCRDEIADMQPDFKLLGMLGRPQSQSAPGVCVTAPGEDCDFVSRFFCPGDALEEDPVTGSAHSMLVPYWAQRLGKSEFFARQISRRGGELYCRLNEGRVLLKGKAKTYMAGNILLEI